MKTYMLWFNNAAKGPTTLEKLKELLEAKKISSESFVIDLADFQAESPNNTWVKLGEVLGEIPKINSHSSAAESQPAQSNKPLENILDLPKENISDLDDTWGGALYTFVVFVICIATVWGLVVLVNYVREATKPEVREFRSPQLTDESTHLRYSWRYGNINREVALALLDRFDKECVIQAKAEFDGDSSNAREHAQRAADYLMAAKVFYSTGKYPPGFDSDLATK
jgi:hypothetical protein